MAANDEMIRFRKAESHGWSDRSGTDDDDDTGHGNFLWRTGPPHGGAHQALMSDFTQTFAAAALASEKGQGRHRTIQRIQITAIDNWPAAAFSPLELAADRSDPGCEVSRAGNVSWKQTPGGVRFTSTAPPS